MIARQASKCQSPTAGIDTSQQNTNNIPVPVNTLYRMISKNIVFVISLSDAPLPQKRRSSKAGPSLQGQDLL